jgi:hypothetical protein
MPTRFAITAAGAALLLAQPAFAHHPSGVGSTGGAGPINTISASPLDKGEIAASIAFEWIKFDPLMCTCTAYRPSSRRPFPLATA